MYSEAKMKQILFDADQHLKEVKARYPEFTDANGNTDYKGLIRAYNRDEWRKTVKVGLVCLLCYAIVWSVCELIIYFYAPQGG